MRSNFSILESLLGADSVFAGENLPDPWPQRLKGVFADPKVSPCLVMPTSVEALAEVVICASREGWHLIPAGQGWQLSWGKPSPPVQLILSTVRLNHLIDHAVGDLTLTAQAGMTLQEVGKLLQSHRQMVPLQGTSGQDSSLGGIIATADSGPLRHRYGGVRDLLLGIEFVRADGQRSKAGGRVVKNVAGYDLMKLFTGSYGSLGIVTQVTLRCYPIPDRQGTLLLWGAASNVNAVFRTLQASALTPVAVDLLSTQVLQDYLNTALAPDTIALTVQFSSLDAAVTAQLQPLQDWGKTQNLETLILEGTAQQEFWQTLQCRGRSYFEATQESSRSPRILCKIGVLPTAAIDTLRMLDTLATQAEGTIARGVIHGGSGLGWVELEPYNLRFPVLESLRRHCQNQGGFLSVLEGPVALKQQIDVWGYGGNALSLMQGIKHAFDPQNLLSPQRFLGA
ncbi:MAG: FAD-binding oxidoreductase [Prochlorotrichaceae cyanobacterium]